MAGLKAEINRILTNETSKIEKEKEQKRKEIKTKLASMSNLASEHINRGSKHSTEVVDSGEADEELMKQYDQKSESYENEVEDDDSEDQDDLLSSGDDNPAGGADSSGKKMKQPEKMVQDEKVIAAKEVEKASFQTALDIPDDDTAIVATTTTAEKVEAKPAE